MWWDYKLEHLKIATNGHQFTKTTEDKKFIFWINAHAPIEKQSNQDLNTPIHLENNGPNIKVPLIFWFLIIIFYFCFYRQLWVKWLCTDIGNSSGKLIHVSQNICGCLILNKMHIKLTSLIICLNENNLISASSPSEGKKQYCI